VAVVRIVVNSIAADSGGALSILQSLHHFLQYTEQSKEHEWIFLLGGPYVKENESIKVIVLEDIKKSWFNRLKFDLYKGKSFISSLHPDIVFSLQNTITFGMNCPQVVYMHQSIPFQNTKNFSFFQREERMLAVYQHLIGKVIKESIKRADKTIVQTEWIKEAVIKRTGIGEGKVIKIPPPRKEIDRNKRMRLFQRHRFFYPAGASSYKNHNCIYAADKILQQKGIDEHEIDLTIECRKQSKNIRCLGSISFERVLDYYESSTLIFPSYIETAGLPLIEARQLGTIILAADLPYAREMLTGYKNAYFFHPFQPDQLAGLMENIMTGEITAAPVEEKKQENYSGWHALLKILEETAGETPPPLQQSEG
jgi:glycosyltransferase involved in cell wall biosynthesis